MGAATTFGVFLKPLADEFGWSRGAVSAAFGIAAVMVAVCSPALGYLLDRISPRRVIVPCLTIFGCAFASLSLLTPRLWHLYAVFVILGVVGNGTAQMARPSFKTTCCRTAQPFLLGAPPDVRNAARSAREPPRRRESAICLARSPNLPNSCRTPATSASTRPTLLPAIPLESARATFKGGG